MKAKSGILTPRDYALASILITPISALMFIIIGLLMLVAWPVVPILCYFQRRRESKNSVVQRFCKDCGCNEKAKA